jgi:transaldolase
MKLFLDTANVDEVAEIAAWGILDGVTTNPSLVLKAGGHASTTLSTSFKDTVLKMCELVPCVSAQVTTTDAAGMIKQGEEYHLWHKHVVVKVPVTGDDGEWLKALKHFSQKKIRTNTTLVFSVNQAILAAKAGATIISPFIGRLDDSGVRGMDLIAEIMTAWKHYGFTTEVLVASTRNPRHIEEAALYGAHICTIPYKVFKELPKHALSEAGLKKFLEDWEQVQKYTH